MEVLHFRIRPVLYKPERLAELDGLCEEVTTNNGIHIKDTLKFFKGDKPAAQFEAGITCGGHFPCVRCVCSASRFSDFAHASYCDQRTFESIQKVALEGVYGKRQGHLKFYDNLNAKELRKELEKRGCKEYPNSKHGKLGILKNILCGVQRVPSLMMFSPEI